MNNKLIIGVVIIIGIAVSAYAYSAYKSSQSKKAAQEILESNQNGSAMENKDSSINNTVTGKFEMTREQTKMAWTAKKSLVADYADAGSIEIQSGEVELKEGKVVSANAVIDINSIKAVTTGRGDGQDKLSTHLKSTDFFDALKFPTAELKISEASLVNSNANESTYDFKGTLTMKGITQEVNFQGLVTVTQTIANLKADITLDRTLWGINYGSSKVANSFIEDNFLVQINATVNLSK